MLNVIIVVLTVAYILVAYVGPVAALGLSGFWAYQFVQTGGSWTGAIGVFIMSAIVLLVVLIVAKKFVKWAMNKVDLDDEEAEDQAG